MDRFAKKQQQIDRRAVEVIAAYPTLWAQMIQEWRQPGQEDRAWLMYSANYLFRTGNIRWTLDPLRLRHRLAGAPDVPVRDLKDLNFILLTHTHGDHLDLGLLRQLKDFPILWVVPAPVLVAMRGDVDVPAGRLIVPEPMRAIEIQGIKITPFDGLHWEKQNGTDSLRGVPAMGYLVEWKGKRWLFPGDTRSYDASQLPPFGLVDVLFAHLWLGRCAALHENPPLLDAFCRFCIEIVPKRIILAHLEEFGRPAGDFWEKEHARKVSGWFRENNSKIHIDSASLGECFSL